MTGLTMQCSGPASPAADRQDVRRRVSSWDAGQWGQVRHARRERGERPAVVVDGVSASNHPLAADAIARGRGSVTRRG